MPEGTKERKRAAKAAPDELETDFVGPGCSVALLVYLSTCALLYFLTKAVVWIVFGGPAVLVAAAIIWRKLNSRAILRRSRLDLHGKGIRCIVVYSDSPIWGDRIRTRWLPQLGASAVTLNWSQRKQWPDSTEVRLFRHFAFGERNFNPCVLVLRGSKRPAVYRFYYAFQQIKHGRPQYLETLENRLFEALKEKGGFEDPPL